MSAFRKGQAAPKAATPVSVEADPIVWKPSKNGTLYGTITDLVRNKTTGKYEQNDPLFSDPRVQASFLAVLDKAALSGFSPEAKAQATAWAQGNAGLVAEAASLGYPKEALRIHFGYYGPQLALSAEKPKAAKRKL